MTTGNEKKNNIDISMIKEKITSKKDQDEEVDVDTIILNCVNPDPKSVKKIQEAVASKRPKGTYSRQALTRRLAILVNKGVLKSVDNPRNLRETLYGFPDAIDKLEWGRSRDDIEFTTLDGLLYQEINKLISDWLVEYNRHEIDLSQIKRARIIFGAVRAYEDANKLLYKRPWYVLASVRVREIKPQRYDLDRGQLTPYVQAELDIMKEYYNAYLKLFPKNRLKDENFEHSSVSVKGFGYEDYEAIRRGDDILTGSTGVSDSYWMEFYSNVLVSLKRLKRQ